MFMTSYYLTGGRAVYKQGFLQATCRLNRFGDDFLKLEGGGIIIHNQDSEMRALFWRESNQFLG